MNSRVNSKFDFRLYKPSDLESLTFFLSSLSRLTRSNYAPHDFSKKELTRLLHNDSEYLAYLALENDVIIAYYVFKKGWMEYEWQRLRTYPIPWNYDSVCTLAPVVGEKHQNLGIGSKLFQHIVNELKTWNFDLIILWGGVKSSNKQAIRYYQKLGFQRLGEFQYEGHNLDMLYHLNQLDQT